MIKSNNKIYPPCDTRNIKTLSVKNKIMKLIIIIKRYTNTAHAQ